MPDQPQIADITIDRPHGVIRLRFEGGPQGTIALTDLRLACPCATCRRARQLGRATWEPRGDAEAPTVRSAELVGAWGLSILWADGHSTGIYPFTSLAAWLTDGHPPESPDSGLPG